MLDVYFSKQKIKSVPKIILPVEKKIIMFCKTIFVYFKTFIIVSSKMFALY